MSGNLARRLAAVEALVNFQGCITCRDWPALVIQIGAEEHRPAQCPTCGRDATHVIRIVQRDDGPQ